MGREWYRVGGGGGGISSKSKGDTKTASCSGGGNSRSKSVVKERASSSSSAAIGGCMNALFHLFDFHHFHFPVTNHHHRQIDIHASLPPEMEAPRNSLESIEEAPLSPLRRDNNLNLSIKTKPTRSSKLQPLTSHESCSPSTKTPTLVARLMGLDLLPDKFLNSSSSPTPSSSSSALSHDLGTLNPRTRCHSSRHKHHSLRRNSVDGGTRSLPETPRISLGRRSDADCYQQRRLSLHINRDSNVSESEQGHKHVRSMNTRVKKMKVMTDDKENRSPREYARQLVTQLKESVGRRMGNDVTNTTRTKEQARDHHHNAHKNTTSDSSPRSRFLENPKAKPASPKPPSSQTNVADRPRFHKAQEEPQTEEGQEEERKQEGETRKKIVKKCKKQENEMKFGSRLVKPPQTMQEEPFVRSPVCNRSSSSSSLHHHHADKKFTKTLLSNDLCNFTNVSSLLPVKKDPSNLYVDLLKVTKTQTPRHRASEFSSCPRQTRTHIARKDITTSTTSPSAATTRVVSASALDYITRMLRRAGIHKDAPISYVKWFSTSRLFDPSIFYFLEHFGITSARSNRSLENLGLRCNRKLLFDLVDEILVDVLKPHVNTKPWLRHHSILTRRDLRGSELIDELCRRIMQFPMSECRVLEDIDALVVGDFPVTETQRDLAIEEEGEGIVTELERQILEALVCETTAYT